MEINKSVVMIKPKKSSESKQPSETNGGVVYGLRGCLTTSLGSIFGFVAGVVITLWSGSGKSYNLSEDIVALIVVIAGGSVGATIGALFGIIIGTRRR